LGLVDHFTSTLLSLPPELDIISDSIYSASPTLDGRHFAQEFVRRRKMAEKGQLPPDANGIGALGSALGGSGGWEKVGGGGSGGGEVGDGLREGKREGFQVVGKKRKGGR